MDKYPLIAEVATIVSKMNFRERLLETDNTINRSNINRYYYNFSAEFIMLF